MVCAILYDDATHSREHTDSSPECILHLFREGPRYEYPKSAGLNDAVQESRAYESLRPAKKDRFRLFKRALYLCQFFEHHLPPGRSHPCKLSSCAHAHRFVILDTRKHHYSLLQYGRPKFTLAGRMTRACKTSPNGRRLDMTKLLHRMSAAFNAVFNGLKPCG